MTADNDALKDLDTYYLHSVTTRATDSPYLRSVRVAIEALRAGATVKDAFDAADKFAADEKAKRGSLKSNSQS